VTAGEEVESPKHLRERIDGGDEALLQQGRLSTDCETWCYISVPFILLCYDLRIDERAWLDFGDIAQASIIRSGSFFMIEVVNQA